MLKDVEPAVTSIATVGARDAEQNGKPAQQTLAANESDPLPAGVGALASADINEASIRISVLQVQQQLGVQALSIANANTQMILKLFES
jgi:flagellin